MAGFLGTTVQLLVLLNPFAVLATFLALAGSANTKVKKQIIRRCTAAIILSGTMLLFCGNIIFQVLGINIDLFKAGGGIILMISAVTMVCGRESGGKNNDKTHPENDLGIAVVPLAIPMAVGPGTAAGLIIIGIESMNSPGEMALATAALAVATAAIGLLLHSSVQVLKFFGKGGISVITKLTGLFLSAIAAKLILEGIQNTLKL